MASKYLRDISIYADRAIVEDFAGGFVAAFHRHACCITEQILHLLDRKLLTNGVSKVHIDCIDGRSGAVWVPSPDPTFDVLCCRWPFPFREYQLASDLEKRKLLATCLHDCLSKLATDWHWDLKVVENAFVEAESKSFQFVGLSKASWRAPATRHRVRVAFQWNLDRIDLHAVLLSLTSGIERARKPLGYTFPEMGQLSDVIASQNGRWITATEFELESTDFLRKRWSVSFAEEIDAPET